MRGTVARVALVVALAATASAEEVGDDVRAEAQAHDDRGRRLFGDGDFIAAALEFEQAQALWATITDSEARLRRRNALSNTATSYARAGMPVEAQDAFALLRELYASELDAGERAQIDDAISRLADEIGTLTLRGVPAGAELRLDAQLLPEGAGQKTPLRVAAGDHILEARAPAMRPWQTRVTVAGRSALIVTLEMEPATTPARVRIESTVQPARVWVDDVDQGDAPLELTLSPGAHRYKVTSRGYREETGGFDAVPGERAVVRVALAPRRAPTGLSVDPYFMTVFPLRTDTPFGSFNWGGGLTLWHSVLRFSGLRAGATVEAYDRPLNRFGWGVTSAWCPDATTWARGTVSWCPARLSFLLMGGGFVAIDKFRSGLSGARLSTGLEARFPTGGLFLRVGLGIGYEQYGRSELAQLVLGTTTFEFAFGLDL